MAAKGPIYKEKDVICDPVLLGQLKDAVFELETKMQVSRIIYKGDVACGFGVDKIQKGIAADSVISVARAIKALKGW